METDEIQEDVVSTESTLVPQEAVSSPSLFDQEYDDNEQLHNASVSNSESFVADNMADVSADNPGPGAECSSDESIMQEEPVDSTATGDDCILELKPEDLDENENSAPDSVASIEAASAASPAGDLVTPSASADPAASPASSDLEAVVDVENEKLAPDVEYSAEPDADTPIGDVVTAASVESPMAGLVDDDTPAVDAESDMPSSSADAERASSSVEQ